MSIVVLTSSGDDTLAGRLATLDALPFDDAEIIVVGDNVDDQLVSQLQTHQVHSAGPGHRAQCDAGARLSTGEVIVYLSPGAMLSADLVADLTYRFGAEQGVYYQFQS